MKAYVLDYHSKEPKVQIGNKIYYVTTGKVEDGKPNSTQTFNECEYFVEVPFKSIAGARLAITLIEERPAAHRNPRRR